MPKKAKKKTVVRREYTKADVKELRGHSKAKTPVVKIAKLTKRSVGSLAEGAQAWDSSRPPALGPMPPDSLTILLCKSGRSYDAAQ